MPLAQKKVEPRFFSPQIQQYMARGAYAGGGVGGGAPQRISGGQAQQIDPAAAMAMYKMIVGNNKDNFAASPEAASVAASGQMSPEGADWSKNMTDAYNSGYLQQNGYQMPPGLWDALSMDNSWLDSY